MRRVRKCFDAKRRDRGFALVIVLWALGIIAILAATFAKRIHTETLIARNLVLLGEAEALADGGVYRIAAELARARQTLAPTRMPNGSVVVAKWACQIDGTELLVLVEDEAGKVDLNMASDRMLTALLDGFGSNPDEASRLVDRIVDFRDSDELRRLNGAESREYDTVGQYAGPKNASFETVEELEQVLKFPQDLYAAVRPFLTVLGGGSGIDPAVADRRLINALASAPVGSAATESHAQIGEHLPADFVTPSPRRAFKVLSRARTDAGFTFVREAEIALIDRPQRPFVIKMWRRGAEISIGDQGVTYTGSSRSADDCRASLPLQ